jgi:RNA polymerase sigma-70 factor (ECF subfamily)
LSAGPLSKRFAAVTGARLTNAAAERLEKALEAALAAGRAAWPGAAADEGFIDHLARRRPAGAERFDFGPQCSDLYLAWACGTGDRRALQHLEATVLSEVERTVGRMRLPDGVRPDEIVQRVRERALLPRAQGTAAILDYEGTGSLLNWLRTAAIREVVTRSRQGRSDHDDEEALLDLPLPADHPELALARARFRARFREAFAEAVGELPDADKNVLKLSYVDRLPIDRIGLLFGVNKSTISRRLAQTRARLLDRTRALLSEGLDLPSGELDSLLRLVDSKLEVSIPAALFCAPNK